jgi:hypothetical protein
MEFVRPSGLSVTPVVNVRESQDVLSAVKKPLPPCWVYGNPVVGLGSGYRPVAVNMEPIQSAVLILGDIGAAKDPKPVNIKDLPAQQRASVLAKLKHISCFGIKSGVTTTLVQAENLCGSVVEVMPQQGLGQTFLPTKAAFQWSADRWVGLITRLQTAQGSSMKNLHGTDERIHQAQLVVVPASNSSWGYGMYVHPSLGADAVKKIQAQFAGVKPGNAPLLQALDLGKEFRFAAPDDAAAQAMRKLLALKP